MKICLDVRVSTKGGTSTFIDNFVRELDLLEHSHDIQYVFNEGATRLNGRHPRLAAVPYTNRVMEFQWSQLALARLLKQHDVDIYHSLKHVGPIWTRAKSIYRVPAVGQFFGNYPMKTLDHIYWNQVAGQAYRRADLLIAVSDYIADGLREYFGLADDRVVTIHNGCDSLFRRLPPDQIQRERLRALGVRDNYMLCVGNLVPVKNFATAIDAYAMLHQQHRDLPQLVLCGGQRHDYYNQLVQLVADHGLQDQVCFAGYARGEDLLHLYNAATLLIHPSLHEGFSFTILEAMACGVPIVASASTSIPEAAGDAALYHDDPRDAEQLAAHVQRILDDSELAEQLTAAALARAPEFTWQKCVSRTVQAYQRLA